MLIASMPSLMPIARGKDCGHSLDRLSATESCPCPADWVLVSSIFFSVPFAALTLPLVGFLLLWCYFLALSGNPS